MSEKKRNPRWHRDELILTLDMYFQLEPEQISHKNHRIIELSKILNDLPIHKNTDKNNTFRNPNGVGLKLSNFLAIDPQYEGKGMDRYSKLDKEIFFEYQNKQNELRRLAKKIKEVVERKELVEKLYNIPDEEDDDMIQVKEGKVLYKLHKFRERDSKIVRKKKEIELKKRGKLECEVCKFDFNEIYGELGFGFIECHHIKPIANSDLEESTKLDDLALVCSNCHRMLHRKIDVISIDEFKKIVSTSIKRQTNDK